MLFIITAISKEQQLSTIDANYNNYHQAILYDKIRLTFTQTKIYIYKCKSKRGMLIQTKYKNGVQKKGLRLLKYSMHFLFCLIGFGNVATRCL